MKPAARPRVDSRRAAEIVAQLVARRAGYLATWTPRPKSAGDGLTRVWARWLETLLDRLEQAPEKNRLAFLDLLGIERLAATAARAPVVFQLSEGAAPSRLPEGARVAAPAPPDAESSDQVVFETERATGLMPGKLVQAVSLWPGRDQYIDHSASLLAGEPFTTFDPTLLTDTPHHLYLAHDRLLALAGEVELRVTLEVAQASSEHLSLVWESWEAGGWRPFALGECGHGTGDPGGGLDGTRGLTASGTVTLTRDCAESEATEVAGHTSHWVRARLDEPLPLDPDQLLPELTRIQLTAVHRRSLRVRPAGFDSEYTADFDAPHGLTLRLVDGTGKIVSGARVELRDEEAGTVDVVRQNRASGDYRLEFLDDSPRRLEMAVHYLGNRVVQRFLYRPSGPSLARLVLDLILEVDALLPDKAFADAEPLDVTKPFYPLGQAPKPGSTFYIAAPEALSKPGAQLTLHLEGTRTPQDELSVSVSSESGTENDSPLAHRVAWEYYNGRRWVPLLTATEATTSSGGPLRQPEDLTGDGEVEITVPDDAAPVEVHDEESHWLRVRCLSGSYGLKREVAWNDGNGNTNRFTYVLPQPPALSALRLSYVWEDGPVAAETVLAYNDFRHTDHTEAARWPADPFRPFETVRDLTPALYLGFDQPLPADRLGVYFDLAEERGVDRPALMWEASDGAAWRRLAVDDGTRHLAAPASISFIGRGEVEPLARFGTELHWLRARRVVDGPPAEATIRALHPNAVWVSQRETVIDETVGTSSGQAGEVLQVRRFPVLDGERIEVREVEGPRAAVEWRLVAADVLGDDTAIRELERRLGEEGAQVDVEHGDLRLRRDGDKEVTEVWVRWSGRPHLLSSGPDDRHYVIERASGRLLFGDGDRGKVPPAGARVLARRYRTGGGRAGNVAIGAIAQPLTGAAGVEAVFNPAPAEGGADAETMSAVARRGPRTLRHRGRGLAAEDLETLALEASPAVAVARALPLRDAAGRTRPGHVTLVVVPRSEETRPYPSLGLRERVHRYVSERCEAGLAAGRRLTVTGPDYVSVGIEATVLPRDPAAAGEVEAAVRQALERFLHPLLGGAEGEGWAPGRSVYRSDVAAVAERTAGVDALVKLTLLDGGVPQGETLTIPPHATIAAGEIRLTLVGAS